MLDLKPISPYYIDRYKTFLPYTSHRGCEHTFANLILWGEQQLAVRDDTLIRLAYYNGHYSYAFPIGKGDKEVVINAIIRDAEDRGIPCVFMGVYKEDIELLESLFPKKFAYIKSRDSFDYVYDIDSLATLKGRKYHSKRNHLHRFREAFPNYTTEPLTESNLHKAKEFAHKWYEAKLATAPDSDFDMERTALKRAFDNYLILEMDGLLLKNGDDILAFTMGSKMSHNTFDVHFEKALSDTATAYVAINYEFANYIRDKYPEIRYLDREEDMGLPGLRKAKESYRPAFLTEKYRAVLIDEKLRPRCPQDSDSEKLQILWKEAFSDTDDFLKIFYDTAFNTKRCRCIINENQAMAALYIFDCEYNNEKTAYIYAVATSKEHRGKGLCHLLMADTHRYLKDNGYTGAVLVPAQESLFGFYENMGYKVCTYVDEFEVQSSADTVPLTKISAEEYALLRKEYLPEGGIIQEKENLRFLETYAEFFKGENFIFTAFKEDDTLHCVELLGNTENYRGIVNTLGCKTGKFRIKGKDRPFAMYYSLSDTEHNLPSYFGFAFD